MTVGPVASLAGFQVAVDAGVRKCAEVELDF